MRQSVICLLALAFVTFAIGCGNTEAQKSMYAEARDFQLKDIQGNTIKLSDYKGKVIMLNFFATWCPPCRMEMPDFNDIQKEYPDEVKIIGINVGRESLPGVSAFIEQNKLDFTIALDDGRVSSLYGPMPGIPVTVIIDKNFNIARRYIGLRPKEVFLAEIEDLNK